MKNIAIVLVVVAVLGGGYYLMSSKKGDAMMEKAPTDSAMEKTTGSTGTMMEAGAAKEFTVDGFEFGYDKKTITVKKGDTVKITLTSSGKMPHDWVVDEFTGAKTKKVTAGQTDTITFVADKAGEFEYYCSVGQHRANGMVGKLIVE